jgi:hypothetical protein
MDSNRRTILTTGAAVAATAAVPQVFAQQGGQGGGAASFYEKGNRYQEIGSGFPLLVTPGGGLNSRIGNWPNAVFNAMDAFKNDFRCITMDQRNASGGESTGPIPIDDPWGRHECLGQGVSRTARRRADGDNRKIPAQPLPPAARLRIQRVARFCAHVPDANACPAGTRHPST